MVLSILKMCVAAENYFTSLASYFCTRRRCNGSTQPLCEPWEMALQDPSWVCVPGEPEGRWFGNGATALGLSGCVEQQQYGRLHHGFQPLTNEPLVQNAGKPDHVPCWDLCFSPPKALSVLWSQVKPELRAELERVMWKSARDALNLLEERFAYSRTGKASKGCNYVPVSLTVAMHEHGSSRALDPDLHIHCQVFNVGVDAKGRTRTLYSKPVFVNKMLLGAFQQAKLAHYLRTELGVELEAQGRGFTIPGIPGQLIKAQSKRRHEILQQLAEWNENSAIAASAAAVATRAQKDKMVSRHELFEQWQKTNQAHGFGDRQAQELFHPGGLQVKGSIPQAIDRAIAHAVEQQHHFSI